VVQKEGKSHVQKEKGRVPALYKAINGICARKEKKEEGRLVYKPAD